MQFNIVSVLAALALAAPTLAAPTAGSADIVDTIIETRGAAAKQDLVDFWSDAGFLGLKRTGNANFGDCIDFPSNFNDIVTSAKARSGRCTVWVNKQCKGDAFTFNKDGVSSLPSWINDKSSSWKCVAQ